MLQQAWYSTLGIISTFHGLFYILLKLLGSEEGTKIRSRFCPQGVYHLPAALTQRRRDNGSLWWLLKEARAKSDRVRDAGKGRAPSGKRAGRGWARVTEDSKAKRHFHRCGRWDQLSGKGKGMDGVLEFTKGFCLYLGSPSERARAELVLFIL